MQATSASRAVQVHACRLPLPRLLVSAPLFSSLHLHLHRPQQPPAVCHCIACQIMARHGRVPATRRDALQLGSAPHHHIAIPITSIVPHTLRLAAILTFVQARDCCTTNQQESTPPTCNPGNLRPCDPEIFQPCSLATLQSCHPATLQSSNPATMQSCNPATLQSCNLATLQPCNLATLQPCNLATLQPCNPAILQPCDPTILQSCNLATLRPCNPCKTSNSAAHINRLHPHESTARMNAHRTMPPCLQVHETTPHARQTHEPL